MPELRLSVAVVVRRGGDGLWRGEALLVPGSFRCGDSAAGVRAAVATVAGELLSRWLTGTGDPSDVQRFLIGAAPEIRWIDIAVPPAGREPAWEQPLALSTPVATWRHGDYRRGVLLACGVEVVADERRFAAACAEQALAALERERARGDLRAALALGGDDEAEATLVEVTVAIETADEGGDAAAGDRAELEAVTRPVAAQDAVALDAVVKDMAALLAGRRPRCVLLVGPSGAGKTTAVRALAARAHHLGLQLRPLLATGGARLVAGMGGYGMWQARCLALRRALAARRGILHVGSLRELMEVGRHHGNATGIADFLRPWLAAGDLLAIAECTSEEAARIEAQAPALFAAFAVVPVPEADDATTRAVLADWRRASRAAVDDDALDAVVGLHRRFAAGSAAPGRPLRFLIDLARDRDAIAGAGRVDRAAVVAAFTRATGVPALLLDPRLALDAAAARAWFRARVAGQDAAIERVVDALALAKADLARRDRPLASLLFIGPTGVGKTELAKALAEFLYGDRGRPGGPGGAARRDDSASAGPSREGPAARDGTALVRFDMSEYADAAAAMRLAGWAEGPMGALVARARREPFAVYLLDEIEKAHPLAFDLLLQALGEGRISDGAGRTGDLRSAVIVLTSNLGAEDAARAITGFAGGGAAATADRFLAAVEGHFRPEFVNRLDAVVPFAALPVAVARQVVARELDALTRREGLAGRGLALTADPALIDALAVFEPASGARGLQRRLGAAVALPLAGLIAARAPARGAHLAVDTDGARLVDDGDRHGGGDDDARTAAGLRRLVQRLLACPAVRALRAERARAASALARAAKRRRGVAMDPKQNRALVQRQAVITAFLERAETALSGALDGEVALLCGGGAAAGAGLADEAQELLAQLWIIDHDEVPSDRAVVGLLGEPAGAALAMAEAVVAVARATGLTARIAGARRAGDTWTVDDLRTVERGLGDAPDAGGALVLVLRGPLALPRWLAEVGVHEFLQGGRTSRVLLTAGPGEASSWAPPAEAQRRGWLGSQRARRRWNADLGRVESGDAGARWDGDLAGGLRAAAEASLRALLLAGIGDGDAG